MFRLAMVVFVILILLSLPISPNTGAEPCAILRVSLPDGTYTGSDQDSWLSDCWLMNGTGLSQALTVRINNTNAAWRSYDTRLIIVLNDVGYINLLSLMVNDTSVPKSSFKLGEPQPYGLWSWPSGDAYPAWFDDTYVNVGTIHRKSYTSLVVSVVFSNATGIRMHFDAYGSRAMEIPCDLEYITHNEISEDSTILINSRSPPGQGQSPVADFTYTPLHPTSFESVTFNASNSYDPDGNIACYRWDFGDDTPIALEDYPTIAHYYTRDGSFTVTLTITDNEGQWDTESKTIALTQTASCLRYLDVKTSPVDITVIPGEGLYEHGTNVNLDAPTYVPDENGNNGQRYRFDHWDVDCTVVSGDPINVLMTANHTATAHYVLQYLITFAHAGLDNTANSTVAAVSGTLKRFSDLPLSLWYDNGSSVNYGYYAAVSSATTGKRFALDHVSGAIPPFTVTGPEAITGYYRVQYFLTITTTSGGTTDRPSGGWFDAGTQVTVSAIPDLDYVLDHWELDGTLSGSANPYVVTMNSAHHLHAVFEYSPPHPPEYYLIVRTDPLGVTSISGEGFYEENSDVVLAAPNYVSLSAGTRYRFDYWDVDGIPREESLVSIIVHMNANHTATAHYTRQYYLTVKTVPSGLVVIPGEGWYDASTLVPLSAPEVEGHEFLYWDVDELSQGSQVASITVLMCAPRTATANYQPIFVGGASAIIESPPLVVWVSMIGLLTVALMSVRFWVERRQRRND